MEQQAAFRAFLAAMGPRDSGTHPGSGGPRLAIVEVGAWLRIPAGGNRHVTVEFQRHIPQRHVGTDDNNL
jgi:hypothetical protein